VPIVGLCKYNPLLPQRMLQHRAMLLRRDEYRLETEMEMCNGTNNER
jgi:hypothetical protein